MEDRDVLGRLDEERRCLVRDGEVVDICPGVTRVRSVDPSRYQVLYSSLDAAGADAAIAREVEHHRTLGVGFEWKVYAHDTPPDLLERLGEHGFELGPRETVLVYEIAQRAGWIDEAGHLPVVRVERPEQIVRYRCVAEEVFQKDYAFTAAELAHALRSDAPQHWGYMAYDGAKPVSIGRLYTHPQSHFAGLYGGATLASHRRRGFYHAIVAARARDAAAQGAKYLLVDALPTSCPILERMGFRRITDTWPCQWTPR